MVQGNSHPSRIKGQAEQHCKPGEHKQAAEAAKGVASLQPLLHVFIFVPVGGRNLWPTWPMAPTVGCLSAVVALFAAPQEPQPRDTCPHFQAYAAGIQKVLHILENPLVSQNLRFTVEQVSALSLAHPPSVECPPPLPRPNLGPWGRLLPLPRGPIWGLAGGGGNPLHWPPVVFRGRVGQERTCVQKGRPWEH